MATRLAFPGTQTLTCTYLGESLSYANALFVYDTTPISNTVANSGEKGVVQFSPDPTTGAFYVTIFGQFFGMGPRQAGAVTDTVVGYAGNMIQGVNYNAQYSTWSDNQVNVLITPTATASGPDNIYVFAQGAEKTNFEGCCIGDPAQSNPAPANFVKVRIFLNGTDITNGTPTVVVGQQIALTTTISGGSIDPNTTPTWSIQGTAGSGGTYVGGYANASGGPVDVTTAQVVPVTTNQPSITYYYTLGGTTAVPVQSLATYRVMVGGVAYTAQTTFQVVAPTGPLFTATALGATAIGIDSSGSAEICGYPCVVYGIMPQTDGVSFSHDYVAPSGYPGTFQWVQAGKTTWSLTTTAGAVSGVTNCSGVDTQYPLTTDDFTGDSPSAKLPGPGYVDVKRTDSFTMMVMFKPNLTGAIFVPIASVPWSWAFEITSTDGGNTWAVASSTPAGTLSPTANTVFLIWSSNITACRQGYPK